MCRVSPPPSALHCSDVDQGVLGGPPVFRPGRHCQEVDPSSPRNPGPESVLPVWLGQEAGFRPGRTVMWLAWVAGLVAAGCDLMALPPVTVWLHWPQG